MGAISTLADVGLNAALSRSTAKDRSKELAAEAERDVTAIRAKDAAERKQRAAALKESLARSRALAATAGTGGASGSSAAVRRGIRDKALDEDAQSVQEREFAISNVRARADARRERNLLESRNKTTRQAFGGAVSVGRSLLDR
jgi:ribosomal protein L29